jgi:hypothetical protein
VPSSNNPNWLVQIMFIDFFLSTFHPSHHHRRSQLLQPTKQPRYIAKNKQIIASLIPISMTFKGYGNSDCPLADCPKNCNHSPTRNSPPLASKPSTEDQEDTTHNRPSIDNSSSQFSRSRSTTATDGTSGFYSSEEPSRVQSSNTTSCTSPSPEKQEAK